MSEKQLPWQFMESNSFQALVKWTLVDPYYNLVTIGRRWVGTCTVNEKGI